MVHKCLKLLSHLGLVQIAFFVQTLTLHLLERQKNCTGTASVSLASSRPQQKGFPKAFLSTSVELNQRAGDFFFALVSDSAGKLYPAMAAFVWMDRERIYFIVAMAGALLEGTPNSCCRWRQVSQDWNAPPERVTMTIKQLQIAEIYNTTCGAINRHNQYIVKTIFGSRRRWKQRIGWFMFTFLFLP